MNPLDAELQERYFAGAEESPGGWFLTARNLRAAAARLDWLAAPARDDEPVSFIHEYRMLLGLAFENILKGVICLVRIEAGQRPPLPRKCFHHSLAILAARPECEVLGLSVQEIELLEALTPFIEWRGKYPLPKKQESYGVSGHGRRDHDAELVLWNRLAEHLAERSWIMKGGPEYMGGKRLYIRRSTHDEA